VRRFLRKNPDKKEKKSSVDHLKEAKRLTISFRYVQDEGGAGKKERETYSKREGFD